MNSYSITTLVRIWFSEAPSSFSLASSVSPASEGAVLEPGVSWTTWREEDGACERGCSVAGEGEDDSAGGWTLTRVESCGGEGDGSLPAGAVVVVVVVAVAAAAVGAGAAAGAGSVSDSSAAETDC